MDSPDLSASFSVFTLSKIMEYLQIVENQTLSTKLNRNKVRMTTHTKYTAITSNYKLEEVDSNKTDSLDLFISFFQQYYLVKKVEIITSSKKTSAVNKTQ